MVTVREQQALLCVLEQGSWETGPWEPQELLCSSSQKVFVTMLATPEAQVGLSHPCSAPNSSSRATTLPP